MAWNGYFNLGDREFINIQRTLTYARNMNMAWVKDSNDTPYLNLLLGDDTYTTPTNDLAPWYDPADADSGNFAGLIPLDVGGIEDSTREAIGFDYVGDGGNPGRIRNNMKEVVFNVALVGLDDAAVEYGFRWLKRSLLKRQCVTGGVSSCAGEDLTYVKVKPIIKGIETGSSFYLDGGAPDTTLWEVDIDGGTPSGTVDPGYDGMGGISSTPIDVHGVYWNTYARQLRDAVVIKGPTVTSQRTLPGCNGSVWLATFTVRSGDPFEYGLQRPILRDLGDETDPWSPGLSGAYGDIEYVYSGSCAGPVYAPIFDPTCAVLVTPPPPPSIAPSVCYDNSPGDWQRWYADIPSTLIPLWDEVRPIFTIRTGATEGRMLKIRLYEIDAMIGSDCDGLVAEYVIQYIPANINLVIDTAQRAVYSYDASGNVRRADSLVFSAGAMPIKYIGLSCGVGYRVAVERATDNTANVRLDLDLVPRTA